MCSAKASGPALAQQVCSGKRQATRAPASRAQPPSLTLPHGFRVHQPMGMWRGGRSGHLQFVWQFIWVKKIWAYFALAFLQPKSTQVNATQRKSSQV